MTVWDLATEEVRFQHRCFHIGGGRVAYSADSQSVLGLGRLENGLPSGAGLGFWHG